MSDRGRCIALCAIAAFMLYLYDDMDRHKWIVALCAPSGMYLALRLIPNMVGLSGARWTFEADGIRFHGRNPGYVRFDGMEDHTMEPVEGLDGYYLLAVKVKKARISIVLNQADYPKGGIDSLFPLEPPALQPER
ncbi:MAG: hypothetical protein EOP88_22445 [Verrucomicrobiaceae bacterium]|nr:MAG: hypothetical protein EOP88_22445 [Verrucomicrobiaceae bacterium]